MNLLIIYVSFELYYKLPIHVNLAYHYPETNILPLCQDIFHFPARFPLAKYCAEVNVRCLNSTVSITALFTIARTWKQSFPVGSDDKEPPCNAGDPGSIPGLGRYLEKGMATHSNVLV